MLPLPFQFFYAIISLQIEFGTIISELVVGGVAGLEDRWGDAVGSEKICGLIIEVAVLVVKEEDLWIDLASSTGPTEETHCLHPSIPVHISRRSVVD